MRRLVPAFVLAVLLHALLLNAAPAWLDQRASHAPMAQVVTMQLIDRMPDRPAMRGLPKAPPLLPPVPEKKAVSKAMPEKRRVRVKPVHPKFQPSVRPPAITPVLTPSPAPAIPASAALPDNSEADSSSTVPQPSPAGLNGSPPTPHFDPSESDAAPGGSRTDSAIVVAATPRYSVNPPPVYPAIARKRGDEGTVLLEVHVDEAGRVDDLRIAASSGYNPLDRAALKAVRRWRFEPGRRGDRKIAVWVRVPVIFRLHR